MADAILLVGTSLNMAPHLTLPVLCEKSAECQSVDLWVANKVWANHLSRARRTVLLYVDVTRVETDGQCEQSDNGVMSTVKCLRVDLLQCILSLGICVSEDPSKRTKRALTLNTAIRFRRTNCSLTARRSRCVVLSWLFK